jgi:hypothetical protein
MRGSDKMREEHWWEGLGAFQGRIYAHGQDLFAAIVLTIGLGGYAVAQDTAPGSPAGTKPMTPEPMMHMHHHVHHHSMHPKHHDMAAPVAAPADAPK